jgi:NTP pyrophosphatase (non-canonical NTP hydrolase)
MKPDKFQRKSLKNGDNVKLSEYQTAAKATAIYPAPLMYPALGLCGECGELVYAISENKRSQIRGEIGDVLWYVANVAADADLLLSDVVGRDTFNMATPLSWCVSGDQASLVVAAGIVAENVKKTIRDHGGKLTESRREKIRLALLDMLVALRSIASHYNVTLSQCAKENVSKLKSRQERGVLKGDGDNR